MKVKVKLKSEVKHYRTVV